VTAGAEDEPASPGGHGRLYVVATPIGNLADITLRALDVLRSVALIAAEDTRLTRRLLDRHRIETRSMSYHARSGPGRTRELLERLRAGDDVALVTDAGTPGVSDPGEELVAAAQSGELTLRGEFAIVIGATDRPTPGRGSSGSRDLEAALAEVERRAAAGTPRGEAARQVAAETGLPRRRLYQVPEGR